MTEISTVFARGAESDPEREEAKKILEEVNLEELERAVEGIEGDDDDEELRGFARDVSGSRGEGASPPVESGTKLPVRLVSLSMSESVS